MKERGTSELTRALATARKAERTSVLVIETDPAVSTTAGGYWWDVAVPEVSERSEVRAARERYAAALQARKC
jgi:3D-(3,5/4)-trihydroxycyclohexane-1,2-dione acylhydrolase (decyclizing)